MVKVKNSKVSRQESKLKTHRGIAMCCVKVARHLRDVAEDKTTPAVEFHFRALARDLGIPEGDENIVQYAVDYRKVWYTKAQTCPTRSFRRGV